MRKIPRKLSWVKFIFPVGYENTAGYEYNYPWGKAYDKPITNRFLFFGEIVNMKGHCVVFWEGNIYSGYHTDSFVELNEDTEV